jgi:N-acetyl-anhydromuramyl-L-alanine amidase AmpD
MEIHVVIWRWNIKMGDGIVQLVQQLAMGWPAGVSEFKSRQGQNFSSLHIIQTSSEAHPASYPMGTGSSFAWG